MGFIEEFSNFILEHIPTNKDWAEAISTVLLSTAVGPNRRVSSKINPLKLNVWFLMIGPSGLAYKSAPLNYFALPCLAELSKILKQPVILPSRYSLEGMIEYLAKVQSWGAIVRDEFTGIFKETHKEYLADMLEFLSELYDGTMQKRYTRKAKLEEACDVYVTFVSASTPYLFRIMKPDFFIQGTGNRLLYILYQKVQPEKFNPDDFFYSLDKQQLKEERLMEFAKALGNLYQSKFMYIYPMGDSAEIWTEVKYKFDLESLTRFEKDVYDPVSTYLARMPEMTLKLSALHCISRSYQSLPKSELVELMMGREDIEWAIKKIETHLEYFKQLLETWRLKPNPVEPRTLSEQVELVISALQESREKGIEWSQLRRKMKWERRVWQEVMNLLWETKMITAVKVGSELFLFLKTYEPQAIQKGKPIKTWGELSYQLGFTF